MTLATDLLARKRFEERLRQLLDSHSAIVADYMLDHMKNGQMPRLRTDLRALLLNTARAGIEAGVQLGVAETQSYLGIKNKLPAPAGVSVGMSVKEILARASNSQLEGS
jgi:hypothetical protein